MRDLAFGCVMLTLAAGYALMAARLPQSQLADAIGPQGLPNTYATLLAALSLILIVRSVISLGQASATPAAPQLAPAAQASQPQSRVWLRVSGLLLSGAIYIAIVPWLGYVLSLAGLIFATTYFQGGGLNRRVALVALSGAIVLWVLFFWLLGIPHPPGVWPSLI